MRAEGKMSVEEERMKVANAIPWGLLKTERIFLPIWIVMFVIHLIRLQTGFEYGEGKWILGIPAPIFEAWTWGIIFLIVTIVACTFWIREVRERMRKAEREGRK